MIEVIGLLIGWIVTTIVGVIKLSAIFKNYIKESTTKDVLTKKDIEDLQNNVSTSNTLLTTLTEKIDSLRSSVVIMERDILQLQKDSLKFEKRIEALSEDVLLLKAREK